ncbi:hypothetical protein KC332_g9843 [Hortaea werneckii]|nr:hypothetical protein KC350_g16774 [Hortaea werneckii]KAI6820657.1 hypothetical protein KC358_g9372 [Hortaea werneckii]KAI6921768.1 hypothetical protein KC348_g10036 [Hortaea werneckii]KAI6932241.1 hypothetical protein KC341_g9098 [Hortaea werneckii]KAI6966649.1 hypothetical protein KC321_g9453 [Hortaea werneckii]
MKTCQICYGEVSQLRDSPLKCTDREGRPIEHRKKSQRACQECWEVHLSNEVEEKPAENIECLFCHTKMSEDQVKSFAWAATYRRYKWKTENRHFQRCQDRCAASRILDEDGKPVRDTQVEGFPFMYKLQEHDRETDGNLFACEDCGFETCVDCDRPRHDGEPCPALQTRLGLLQPLPEVHERIDGHAVGVCPSCNSYFIIVEGCGDYPSTHTIKNRFVGQREAFDAHMEQRKQKRPKKATKAKKEDGDVKTPDDDKCDDDHPGTSQQPKRRKRKAETSTQGAGSAKQSKKSKA